MDKKENIGIFYAVIAFVFWGLVPIYFKQVALVNPFEVLIHRIIWSVVVLSIFLLISKRFYLVKNIFNDKKKLKLLFYSSFFVSLNWLIFIYAISQSKILEASLGYFINPLISVLFAYIFLKERLSKIQILALFIAFIAIVYQILLIGYLPLISIGLAVTFALYGLLRKKIDVESLSGLFIETFLILPFALIYFIYLIINGQSAIITQDTYIIFMLSLSGLITVLPLLWFNNAVTKINLSTIGILQYLGPSVAFLVAIFIYNEELDINKLISFILIWLALIIFSYDLIIKNKLKLDKLS